MQNFFGAEEGGERCVDFEGIFETLFISIYCFKVISYTDSIERMESIFFYGKIRVYSYSKTEIW